MNVHPTALVAPGARLADDVEIGAYTVVHDDVVLEAGCRIGTLCELGADAPGADGPLHLGAGALVRSQSVLYRGSRFGSGLRTGAQVCLREGLDVAEDAQIGQGTELQGDSVIGRSFRTQSGNNIGKHMRIGDYVWIFANVMLTNDPHPPSEVQQGITVGDFAAICTSVTVLPGVTIGKGAFIAAHTLVRRDVAPGRIVRGVPGVDIGPASQILHSETGLPAYPWRRHFHRGYPPEVTAGWVDAEDDDPTQLH